MVLSMVSGVYEQISATAHQTNFSILQYKVRTHVELANKVLGLFRELNRLNPFGNYFGNSHPKSRMTARETLL